MFAYHHPVLHLHQPRRLLRQTQSLQVLFLPLGTSPPHPPSPHYRPLLLQHHRSFSPQKLPSNCQQQGHHPIPPSPHLCWISLQLEQNHQIHLAPPHPAPIFQQQVHHPILPNRHLYQISSHHQQHFSSHHHLSHFPHYLTLIYQKSEVNHQYLPNLHPPHRPLPHLHHYRAEAYQL